MDLLALASFQGHDEVSPQKGESETPWLSHSPAALTCAVTSAGLALQPRHLSGTAITQSYLLSLHLGTEINGKLWRQSRQHQACQVAVEQPCSALRLLHLQQRWPWRTRASGPHPCGHHGLLQTPASPSLLQQLPSTLQQLSNLKAELNLFPLCLQQTTHTLCQGPWAESSYLTGRADLNAACSSFIQWLTVDLSKNKPDGSRDKWSALLEFLKQKKTDACVPLARTHLKLSRWVQMLREVVFRGFSPSRLSN